jgi:hypothetical protein
MVDNFEEQFKSNKKNSIFKYESYIHPSFSTTHFIQNHIFHGSFVYKKKEINADSRLFERRSPVFFDNCLFGKVFRPAGLFRLAGITITIGDIIEILYLLNSYLEKDWKNYRRGKQSSVSQGTIGTLLVCCVLIGLKMTRDIPLKNCWYSKCSL